MKLQEGEMPPRPGKRRPDYYWLPFLDGRVWCFTQGEDFVEVEPFRALIHSFVRRQNLQHMPFSPSIMKVRTRRLLNDEQKWELYLQAYYPYSTEG